MMSKNQFSYDAIGTIATPATLTAAKTGNTLTLFSKMLPNVHLDISYIPKSGQTNRFAEILVEISNDDGTTFFPYSTVSPSAAEVDVWTAGTDVAAPGGTPLIVPGEKVSMGGVNYRATWDGTLLADHIKISARESGSADFGTLYVRATLAE